jgi:hypothetical protein
LKKPRTSRRLRYVEADCAFDLLAFALGGEDGVRYRSGPFVEGDWKDAPLLVLGVALMIMQELRPGRMPSIPTIGFGEDPTATIKAFVAEIEVPPWAPNRKLVAAFEGSDTFFFGLCPLRLNLETLDERVGPRVLRIQESLDSEAESDE